jgi:hypothetical protein
VGGEGEGVWREELAQTMCTHVSTCKNDKVKERKKNSTFAKNSYFISI